MIDLENPIFADIEIASTKSSHDRTVVHHWGTRIHENRPSTTTTKPRQELFSIFEAIDQFRNSDNLGNYNNKDVFVNFPNETETLDKTGDTEMLMQQENSPSFVEGGRGRSLQGTRNAVTWNIAIVEGVWKVRKTPCSVTCGQGK